jgi:hypothetical protein
MLSRRTLIAAVALVLCTSWWRADRPQSLVVLGAAGREKAIRDAMQQIEGAVSGRIDTVNLTHPHRLHIAVRLPTSARGDDEEDPIRRHVDEVLIEAHAHLVWSRLAPFRLHTAFDTVTASLKREYRSPLGLGNWHSWTSGYRYVGPWQRGWSRVNPQVVSAKR